MDENTHIPGAKIVFLLDGGSRGKKYFCLFGSPGAPDTVKYDIFGNVGAL